MYISSYWEKDARVLSLAGQFEVEEWVVLEAALLAAQIGQRRHIVLNLGQVTCSDRRILGKLFFAYLRLRQQGIRLSLVNPQAWIRETFERTNIPALVDYYSSDHDAVMALA